LKLKAWGFKGGVRLEQTYVNADFVTGATKVHQDYLSIIPSFIINRSLKNKNTLNLNFTSRVKRPTIFQLNPFVDRSNPEFESTGNPNLKPATTNVVQLSYNKSKKSSFNIALGSMFFNGLIGPISAYDSARKINRLTFQNFGKGGCLK
jgi:outer membrane receptor protein involved in Fe transport